MGSPSPIPFPLDFGLWIWDLDLGLGFGTWTWTWAWQFQFILKLTFFTSVVSDIVIWVNIDPRDAKDPIKPGKPGLWEASGSVTTVDAVSLFESARTHNLRNFFIVYNFLMLRSWTVKVYWEVRGLSKANGSLYRRLWVSLVTNCSTWNTNH